MSVHVPAVTIVAVLPLIVHTAGDVLANTTGLVEGPGVADTVKVPPGVNTGAEGVAAKFVIAWFAAAMTTLSETCGAAV